MCSQFNQDFDINEYSYLKSFYDNKDIKKRILPYTPAYIFYEHSGSPAITQMNFSLVPSWSKEPKVKFASHNARIETVIEKPTWRKPFESQHCIVPITSFYEPVYEGEYAGNIIEFKSSENPLWAAGIFDIWNKVSYSFSILTTTPDTYIEKHGHDRSPLFLKYESAMEWLHLKKQSLEMLDFLQENLYRPSLKVSIDRPMKPGWEKRK